MRCPICRAPLQLRDEPAPAPLDVHLDLDRRRRRAATPARAPQPPNRDELGDLSFDPPQDDAAWTFAAAPEPEPEPEPAAPARAAFEAATAAWEETEAPAGMAHEASGGYAPRGDSQDPVARADHDFDDDDADAEHAAVVAHDVSDAAESDDANDDELDAATDEVTDEGTDDELDGDTDDDVVVVDEDADEDDGDEDRPAARSAATKRSAARDDGIDDASDAVAIDAAAAKRGRVLSYASMAVAATVALIALLTR